MQEKKVVVHPVPEALSRRRWFSTAAVLFTAACTSEDPTRTPAEVGLARCAGEGSPLPPEQFEAWNKQLRAKTPGRDVVFLDLDTVTCNATLVRSLVGASFALRLVTKSLPCVELLAHLLDEVGTNRLMAFTEGVLSGILRKFGTTVDVLLGRPMPVEGAARVLAAYPEAGVLVKWLIDTTDRMNEYKVLAQAVGRRLDVAVEIDVGLRRGGARTAAELLEMLAIVADASKELRLVGFMGYDGHVPFAPNGFSSDDEFVQVHARYTDFVKAGSQAYPALFGGATVFNSGGTHTCHRYVDGLDTLVNEVALGSGFLLPSRFSELRALGLASAVFGASPVLKRIDPAEVPFAQGFLPAAAKNDSSLEIAFFMTGGAFPGDIVYPAGLVANPLLPVEQAVENILPSQALQNGARALNVSVGDFIFYAPWEGDVLAWLSEVEVLQKGSLDARWPTLREGRAPG